MTISALAFTLFSTLATAKAADWLALSTPHFRLYTTNTERDARDTVATFERIREFFLRNPVFPQTSELPLTLVAFATAREFRPFSVRDSSPAYLTGDETHDYIVMSELGENRDRAATHEFVHVLVRHSGITLPIWLNEGLADVYSTLQVRNGKLLVGVAPKDRTYSLVNDRWMRLPDLLSTTATSSVYNEGSRTGIFYAQSWLLTHMLMLSETYAPKFPRFVARIAKDGSAQAAFSEVYGKSVADIQTAMNTYLRQNTIDAATFDQGPQVNAEVTAAAADTFDVDLTLAKITGFLGHTSEADAALARLAGTHPNHPEIDQARAYVAMQQKDFATAARHFLLAIQHGSTAWQAHWGYARTMEPRSGNVGPRIEALRQTIAGNPRLGEAHALLGSDLLQDGQPQAARAALEAARKLPLHPEMQARVDQLLAAIAEQSALPVDKAEKDDDTSGRPVIRYNRTQTAPKK